MKSLIRPLPILSLCFAIAGLSHAQSHGAHVHGEAELAVVVEGADVSLSLMSAMYNIVGFERAPETEAEIAAVNSAIAALENAADLFAFTPSAGCALVSAQHDVPAVGSEHDHHDDGEEHDHDDHDHDDDHGHHDHRDLEASFEFICDDPGKLASLEVGLFGYFENLEKVNAVVLSGSRQTAGELTDDHRSVEIPAS